MSEAHHAIRAVAQRTGLSTHVIRVWERRYRAVEPERTGSNRRRYSDEQVERLVLLREITRCGHSISAVAKLPLEKLRKLASEAQDGKTHAAVLIEGGRSVEGLLEVALAAVKRLDTSALEEALNRGSTELGAQGLLQRVIGPLAQKLGELWREGTITAAHEHFASAVIRVFLGHATKSFAPAEEAPVLVVATPSGQLHELGALLAAAGAANLGWQITYLGPSLPAAEIAGAARQNRARAVALSLVYPEDDPRLESELTRLRELLPAEVPLLVGGRAAAAYEAVLERIGAIQLRDLAHLGSVLDGLRGPKAKATL